MKICFDIAFTYNTNFRIDFHNHTTIYSYHKPLKFYVVTVEFICITLKLEN